MFERLGEVDGGVIMASAVKKIKEIKKNDKHRLRVKIIKKVYLKIVTLASNMLKLEVWEIISAKQIKRRFT